MRINSASVLLLLCVAAARAHTAPAAKPIDLLRQRLQTISQGVSADWGIYIKSLDTGEEIAINADQLIDTMSTIKIPLLVDVYRQVDAGKLNPADRIVMHTDRQALWHRHRGFYSELEDAIARMSEQVWAYFNYRGKATATLWYLTDSVTMQRRTDKPRVRPIAEGVPPRYCGIIICFA